ncbi:sensor domain-containing diguanylate cyclase [Microbacterium atlanticum]|uniref:GGDEF domain-containing protein n=1 Tax=Microbacterium atlanticum TaxID=2782168 RepID=UPI001886F62D|nr:sensor domain-containing diguanylate cyclase [Microbacterium atlanticum]
MSGLEIDALPVGVVRVDRADHIVESNAWFRRWLGEDTDVTGRVLSDILVPVADFLEGAAFAARMMSCPGHPERAVLVTRAEDADGAVLTVMEAADRYASGTRLRNLHGLADRTQSRLQLIMDASVAFAAATTEERLSKILADTAAQAYRAEDSVVMLFSDNGVLRRTAGTNPFEPVIPEFTMSARARELREVLKITDEAVAEKVSPSLAAAMRHTGVHALIAAPLQLDGVALGLFACFFRHPRVFDDEASPLAEALAGQAAQKLATVRLERRLQHAAMHDDITDLPNRRSLEDLPTLGDHTPASVIFIDLDGFKEVNDTLGHDRGDEVLREVGRRLQQNLREGDVVARYGGDEFVVVCGADAASAVEIAERLREAVAGEEYPFLPASLPIAASIGVATARVGEGVLNVDRLIRRADQAMYTAKNSGGNQVAIAD